MPKQLKRKMAADKATKAKIRGAAEVITENLKARKVGAPLQYHEGFCHLAETMEVVGGSNIDVAELLGCYPSTIDDWLKAHDEFAIAVQRGRERADAAVERATFKSAVGYSHRDTVFMMRGVGMGEQELETIETVKHYPPDNRAARMWLMNRKPQDWRPEAKLVPATDTVDAAGALREAMRAMNESTLPVPDKGKKK